MKPLAGEDYLSTGYLQSVADYIAGLQQADGGIPWFAEGHLDPWDHVEAAMGLTVAGAYAEAEAAYGWMRHMQRDDGSWYASYRDGVAEDDTRAESNHAAYIATGIWHHYLATGRIDFLQENWPMVLAAMRFVLSLQAASGEVYWALDTRTGISRDALVTGCSSIYKSLECMICIAGELGMQTAIWIRARQQLGDALTHLPNRFDRTWPSKARYSMDWFYPVLTGVFQGAPARARLQSRWHEFVQPGMGCRCVADQPWVTVAESCELTLALLAAGQRQQALQLYSWLQEFRADDGGYWMGYQFVNEVLWPRQRPTWTAAAVLLAADAIARLTPAARLFTECAPATRQDSASGLCVAAPKS